MGLTLQFCTFLELTRSANLEHPQWRKNAALSSKNRIHIVRARSKGWDLLSLNGKWVLVIVNTTDRLKRQDNSPAPGLIDDFAHFAACLPSLCLCLLFQFQFEYFVVGNSHSEEISFWPQKWGGGWVRWSGSREHKCDEDSPGMSPPPLDPSGPWHCDTATQSIIRPLPHKVPVVTELEPWTVKMCSIVSTHTHSLIKTQLIDWIQAAKVQCAQNASPETLSSRYKCKWKLISWPYTANINTRAQTVQWKNRYLRHFVKTLNFIDFWFLVCMNITLTKKYEE